MSTEINPIKFNVLSTSADVKKINSVIITAPNYLVNKYYHQASIAKKEKLLAQAFYKRDIPLSFIDEHYKNNITTYTKEFFLNFFVISFLYKELRSKKIILAGDPRLSKVELEHNCEAKFYFEFTPIEKFIIEDWKYLIFRAPKRKKYKDLDKQADSFLKEELNNKKEFETKNLEIKIGDWICFNIYPVDNENKPVLDHHKENLWLKIGDEESSIIYQEIFVGKKINDQFYSSSPILLEYFNDLADLIFSFGIEIIDILPKSHVSLEFFKNHFNLKTNKNVHQKLIEVFSFKNDLSLRKSTIEELFDLFLNKFNVPAPVSTILRQQQLILNDLQQNPDYPVYRMQKEFNEKVYQLAQRQVKEMILIDYISFTENINIDHNDVKNYLHLSLRPRTKELIYFQHSAIKANENEYPIASEVLKHICLREKTLNYILNILTRD
ncbi:MAG: hypothetical protein P4L22_00765 [Candidatus Babeliales bacterium]|nr:hypothetical protein [Candidatus Babeliales bacterium]